MKKKKFNFTFSADNGLVDRRCFLKSGFGVGAGMMVAGAHASEGK